ncbi:MAG: OmpA family protein [Saprospiraceae bacterium]|nr:OmpA family protein [Saprospiraceae bacterium]
MKAFKHNILIILAVMAACSAYAQTAGEIPKVTVQVNNETAVNTPQLEFSATFYEDGIVFVSTNNDVSKKKTVDQGQSLMMSILRSKRNAEGALQAPEVFAKEITSINHEGPVCFDRTAETLFFSSNAVVNGKDQFAKDKVQHTRLYWSKKVNGAWGKPEPLPFNNNEFDDFHPSISIDGDKLFFASNRPGGFGSTDIYVSYKVGESWSEPVNMGKDINSKGREAFPFIHADNTIYYASDGLPEAKGGFDLYYAIPDGNAWTKPVNLGEPFNTGGDDFGLIVDLNKINGYFASNGNGGAGLDDIFNFHTENGNLDDFLLQNMRVPDRNLDLKILVTEKSTGKTIQGAEVQVMNYDANNVIGRDENGNVITMQKVDGEDVISSIPPDKGVSGETDARGRYATEVKPGNYVIIISKKGFQTKQFRLPISKPGNELAAQLEKSSAAAGKIQWNPSLFNYLTNAPMAGNVVVVTNTRTGQKDTLVTDANGMIEHYLDPNTKYRVDVMQGGRIVGTTEVDTNGWKPGQPVMQNLSVAPLAPGTKFDLPNIYYNYNDATLRPDGRKDLDMVVAIMKQQPSLSVEIASHTDSRGSHTYNEDLSQRRANGVVEYLVMKGIARNRLMPHGYGESEPRNTCSDGITCTEKEHARNRRTEIRVLSGMTPASMMYVDGKVSGIDEHQDPSTNINSAPRPGKVGVTDAKDNGFYVVAGSFKLETGAKTRLAELQSLGYSKAEIVRFPNSPYFSVCTDRFSSRKEADAVRKKLESQQKIEAFVKAIQ